MRRKEEEGEGSCDSQILVISLPSAGSHRLSIPPSLMVLHGNYQVSTNSRYREKMVNIPMLISKETEPSKMNASRIEGVVDYPDRFLVRLSMQRMLQSQVHAASLL